MKLNVSYHSESIHLDVLKSLYLTRTFSNATVRLKIETSAQTPDHRLADVGHPGAQMEKEDPELCAAAPRSPPRLGACGGWSGLLSTHRKWGGGAERRKSLRTYLFLYH